MLVHKDLQEEIVPLVKLLDQKIEINNGQVTGQYSSRDLKGLVWFITDFLVNNNSLGVYYYERSLEFRTDKEIQLLAEIFAEKNGHTQIGNPVEFSTSLKATANQIPVFLQYIPNGGLWRFSTHRIFNPEDLTTNISLSDMFP